MAYQEFLVLATRFTKAQANGNVSLDEFLTQESIPEAKRYAVACGIAEFLAHYRFEVDRIAEMMVKMKG